ncbi:glycosyltransferase family 2 protein, partial [Nocardioides sp. GCM10030258]|uniref:glycosyltransferase family 2 protein n=1 Tax=unclassified Nocardioides TaxID=2615069 RepID=UPI003618FE3A
MRTPVVDVTVIIPVYNTVDYLSVCLDSLVGQTIGHQRLEVVAVDDGSTDGSGELLEKYAASYPEVVRVFHQDNSGG